MKHSPVQLVRRYGFLAATIAALAAGLVFDQRDGGSPAQRERQGTVSLVYVNWAEGIAMSNLVKVVLEDDLLASRGPAMTSSLKSAVRQKAPIGVTGWRPHWMLARWKLKFLEDPKGVYGQEENLHTITRKGLAQDMPRVVDFLKAFELDSQQLGSLMGTIRDSSGGPEQAARNWMASHRDLVASWLP